MQEAVFVGFWLNDLMILGIFQHNLSKIVVFNNVIYIHCIIVINQNLVYNDNNFWSRFLHAVFQTVGWLWIYMSKAIGYTWQPQCIVMKNLPLTCDTSSLLCPTLCEVLAQYYETDSPPAMTINHCPAVLF